MKKNIFILTTIIIVIISIWIVFFNGINSLTFLLEKNPPPEIQENVKEELTIVIDDGEKASEAFKSEFKEGMTAFDLLKNTTEKLNLTLKIKNYDIGIFIEAIGNKENGQEGKYWMYYVNGEMPMVAADKQELKPEDKVEFKFEKSPF